jgi:hypothetical protein
MIFSFWFPNFDVIINCSHTQHITTHKKEYRFDNTFEPLQQTHIQLHMSKNQLLELD